MFSTDMTVRDAVLQYPAASDLFKRLKIDFCCGGNRPIAEAAAERGLEADAIVAQLAEMKAQAPAASAAMEWQYMSSRSLIEYVVNKHHRYLREQLPQIAANVARVAHVHGGDQPHLIELFEKFNQLKAELEEHIAKEEELSFPLILAAEEEPAAVTQAGVAGTIQELEGEHDGAGALLKQIRGLTGDFTPPEGACTTYRITYARLEELEGMTFEHVHLENNVLFPRYGVA
ncbi:iron-sulfur cluster repair di-iron protein [Paenibacillus apiarius]|uniref:Iron-sulfur cluster repair di-iron protein n=1 Tax=Paenibacillus apiarius TaxID=46240 RepID=A0ABT4DND2_9BACL|nr:iron-sulfur cluster repair di-iron protein [Paenibacillus apiarius]MCY9514760.1 iron-sulfur cluster repair di-iron protein [Paenibacillus apiarius]MCY9518750.1 iron-sulfur cluster repair di-iron protein [Paenibacillus apiarius]MCY9552809.1 iron-sulfur cluster repair di-iron protein [Paenibacillus apiarius]MCY9556834.1 iron-sulfur cluster repair di-iron protein [Paenibacillus apiarius]MCY9686213.1 iron-sulfur cluster repair di-iron protein [Paenibacillus apiarius]